MYSQTEPMELVLARENLNTLNDFYDEIKKEKARPRPNRLLYEPPTAEEAVDGQKVMDKN